MVTAPAVQVRTLVAPTGEEGAAAAEVTHLAAAPGTRQLAAGHADGTVRLWNLDSGECEARLASAYLRRPVLYPVGSLQ